MFMNDETNKTEINVKELLEEFADFTFTDLVLEIHDLREKFENEQKAHHASQFNRQKAEDEVEVLTGRINSVTTILNGEADICIDCEAVKEHKEK